ncbi:fimbrial protein [Pseudomonas sp.]|uniref:fimbrial protein n=1 Tax=Pseudomonas sp. TaxID=306 RepID=UPI003CC58CB7
MKTTIALATLLTAPMVQGACQYYPGMGPAVAHALLDARIVVSTLALPGHLLYSRTIPGAATALECTAETVMSSGWATPMEATGQEGVYATTVPGVGLRVVQQQPLETQFWPRRDVRLEPSHATPSAAYVVELVKTGPLQEGRLRLPPAGVTRRYGALEATALRFSQADIDIVLNKPTCDVAADSQQVTVNLGQRDTRDFTGPGSTTQAVPFSLRLACEGGGGGDSLFVHLTLSDASDPGNRTTVLSLRNDATALGVGVQVLRSNGQPVSYGADAGHVGNPGQWLAGAVVAGQRSFEVPLLARFTQTGNTVTPGTAGALATFTFAYN